MSYRTVAAVCAALAISGGPAMAELVTNGGFETGDFSGWTVTGDGISVDNVFPKTGLFDAAFGASSVDSDPGMLSQVLTIVPGHDYTLAFALTDESGAPTNSFTVTIGNFSAPITGDQAGPAYTPELFNVPAADLIGTTTTLSFSGTNDTGAWNLDDVSVTSVGVAVPEPSSAAMLGGASVMVLLFWARFRQSSRAL
jgi:hypothetical protein